MYQKIKSVLLIDDDLAINYFHKRLFTNLELGDSIVPFYNGIDALQELQKLSNILNEKDLIFIFLDINMPGIDGWSFLEEYKKIQTQLKCEVKIFILSSSVNPDDVIKAKKNHFVTDYLAKPLMKEGIIALKEMYKLS